MRDRMRWQARGAALDESQRVLLVQHVEHWREKVQGYDLLVPREAALDVQLYGELLILERIALRGALPSNVANLLDALSELTGLIPTLTLTVMTEDVFFAATPMGFERRPRMPHDEILARPETWVHVAEVAPLALPLLTLAEEAARHARPFIPPEVPSTPHSRRWTSSRPVSTGRRTRCAGRRATT